MQQQIECLTDQITLLAEGSVTPCSLAKKSLESASQFAALNAFAALDESVVLAQAKASTLRRNAGKPLSPIDGVPIAVKDNYLTKDYPTTACSDASPLEPSSVDATVVANLRAAGAVIFGKTNMHEWAYGATNTISNIGVTHNPHNHEHITGGSSGGSGAAVAAGIVSAALGSDTGGSVRIPAAACGIYGFKPSYGRASRHGILPLSWSLDAPGPMTTALADICNLLPYFLGPDENDVSTTHAMGFGAIPKVSRPKLLNLSGPGLERSELVDQAVRRALRKTSAQVSDAGLSDITNYFASWEAILHCEAASYHGNLLERSADNYSPVTRAHLEAGKRLTGVELLMAQQSRARLIRTLVSGLPDWDALVLPTLPIPAPRHGDDWQEFGGRRTTTQDSMTWFCWLGNLAGLPCLTLPIAKSEQGLPIGMMLMGKPGKDEELLAIGTLIDLEIGGRG